MASALGWAVPRAPASRTRQGPGGQSADPSCLGDALAHLLMVMERTGSQLAARRRDGLDRAAFLVLHRLVDDGPQRSGAVAEALLADPSTVSRHVAQLVQLGLVERRPDPEDGRATVVAATPLGRERAADARERRNAAIATVVSEWSPSDQDRLRDLMTRFTADLENARPRLLAAQDEHHGRSTADRRPGTTP